MTARALTLTFFLVVAGAADALAQPQALPRFQLIQELRLDGATHDFSDVRKILVARDGRIVIPLEQDHQLRVFDANGRRVANVGRAGDGPGEFDRIGDFVGWLGDTVWVHDFNPRRLTLISPANTVLRSYSTIAPTQPATNAPATAAASLPRVAMTNTAVLGLYADGTMLVRWGFGPRDPDSYAATDVRLVVVRLNGEIVRDVIRLPATAGAVYHRDQSGGVHAARVPFFARPLESIATNGERVATVTTEIASAAGGTYTVTVVRSTADTAFSIAYPFAGVRIPRRAVDSALAAVTARQMELAIEMRSKAAPLVPEVYAPVTSLLLGEDDTVWLGVYSADGMPRHAILDAKGAPIGEVVLPRRATLARATRTHIWTLERDADDLPSVVRYRIQASR